MKVEKLKLALVGLVCLTVMTGNAIAQLNLPTDGTGANLPPSEAPCVMYDLGPGDSASEVAVRSSGPGYISHIILSTGAVTAYAVLKDTGSTSNTSIEELGGHWTASASSVQVFSLRPPLRFTNGLTLKKSTADMKVSVCTRLYGTQVP